MEDFVSFEIAKKLKEKGFREDCIAQVKPDNTIKFNHVFDNNIRTILKCHNKLAPYIDAPTISQVLKWLREEKNYHITIDCYFSGDFGYIIYLISPYECEEANAKYNSYEEAVLAGIEYVLDNLI